MKKSWLIWNENERQEIIALFCSSDLKLNALVHVFSFAFAFVVVVVVVALHRCHYIHRDILGIVTIVCIIDWHTNIRPRTHFQYIRYIQHIDYLVRSNLRRFIYNIKARNLRRNHCSERARDEENKLKCLYFIMCPFGFIAHTSRTKYTSMSVGRLGVRVCLFVWN